jgi:hypothetical protein
LPPFATACQSPTKNSDTFSNGLNPKTKSKPFNAQFDTLMLSSTASGWVYSTSSTGLSRPDGSRESLNQGPHGLLAHRCSSTLGVVAPRPGSVASNAAAAVVSVRR